MANKKNPFLTVYTVTSIDEKIDEPVSLNTIGSYVTRGAAIRECASHILDS